MQGLRPVDLLPLVGLGGSCRVPELDLMKGSH